MGIIETIVEWFKEEPEEEKEEKQNE